MRRFLSVPLMVSVKSFTLSKRIFWSFYKPPGLDIADLPRLAETIEIATLGVTPPPGLQFPERFIAGFRHGLRTNRKTKSEHLNPTFLLGYMWAKYYYLKFAPKHPLALRGERRSI